MFQVLTPFYLGNKQKIKERKRTRRKKKLNLFLDQIDNGFNCRQHTSPPRGPGWQDHCCGNVASPGGNCGHEGEQQVDLDDGGDNDNHGEDDDGSGEDGDDDDGGAIEIVKS